MLLFLGELIEIDLLVPFFERHDFVKLFFHTRRCLFRWFDVKSKVRVLQDIAIECCAHTRRQQLQGINQTHPSQHQPKDA